jgi:hypothetical protein
VSRRKPKKVKDDVGRPTKKSLCVRYAEVLRLRQAIAHAQSQATQREVDRRAPE